MRIDIELEPDPGGPTKWIAKINGETVIDGRLTIIRTINAPGARVWLDERELTQDVEVYIDGNLDVRIPPAPVFVVEDVFEIAGRGVGIVRSRDAAQADLDDGRVFRAGDRVRCGELEAKISGIERWPVASSAQQPQQSLLLGGVERHQVAIGQEWTRLGNGLLGGAHQD